MPRTVKVEHVEVGEDACLADHLYADARAIGTCVGVVARVCRAWYIGMVVFVFRDLKDVFTDFYPIVVHEAKCGYIWVFVS